MFKSSHEMNSDSFFKAKIQRELAVLNMSNEILYE